MQKFQKIFLWALNLPLGHLSLTGAYNIQGHFFEVPSLLLPGVFFTLCLTSCSLLNNYGLKYFISVAKVLVLKFLYFTYVSDKTIMPGLIFDIVRSESYPDIFNSSSALFEDYNLTNKFVKLGDIHISTDIPQYLPGTSWIQNNFVGIASVTAIISLIALMTITCAGAYSWLLPSTSTQDTLVEELIAVTKQNAEMLNAMGDVILPIASDVSLLFDKANKNNFNLAQYRSAIGSIGESLSQLEHLAHTTGITSKSLLEVGTLGSETADQLAHLQTQVAKHVIMLHNHEMWLRSI